MSFDVILGNGSGGGGSGSPGGNSGQLQYNNSGSFGGTSGITTDGTNLTLSSGSIFLGNLGYSDTGILESLQSSTNSYNQLIIQNTNTGNTASSDLIVNNNSSTATTNYGDFGINSSNFSGTGSLNASGYVYLTSTSVDLAIGTTTANAIHFVVNTGSSDALTISSTGGISTPNQITSTLATGTAPFVVASTTQVANLNASQLVGSTWASPGAIGTVSPNSAVFNSLTSTGACTIDVASTNALAVGANGSTNPVFLVNSNTASVATGITVIGSAAGSGVAINAISSGTNEGFTISAKGSGNMILGTAGGSLKFEQSGSAQLSINASNSAFTPGLSNLAVTIRFGVTGAADAILTASTEAPDVYFNLAQTRNHATGALTLQRDFRISGSTHSFSGTSTATDVAVVGIDGLGQAGTNATFTNAHGILIQAIAVSGTVVNAAAVTLNAPTGASTANYALWVQTGNTLLQTLTVNSSTMLTTATTFTNNAGSSAGTITNAPSGGNPTKWIPINDNGTTRNIPAW